jgi:hypothetical protein
MRKYYILSYIFILSLLSACLKDKSNYDYSAHEVITVEGIEKEYTRVSTQEKITLTPTVSSSVPGAEFEYLWGIYETAVQGTAPVLDTIIKAKNIDYLLSQPAKDWVLVFRVTNKKTGYSQYVNATIHVVTPFTRGWYVAKGVAGKTDLDMFTNKGSILPDAKMENMYSLYNGGKQLNGNPVQLNFFSDYKSNIVNSAIFANTRSLVIASENDASTLNINTLKEIRSINSLFYAVPTNTSTSFIASGNTGFYYNNNGNMHTIYNMSANTGQFGARHLKDAANTNYKLSRYYMSGLVNCFFFDDASSSFISVSPAGSQLVQVIDATTTEMPANNTNKNLLYLGAKNAIPLDGYAVMQDKTNPNLKVISKISPALQGASGFSINNDTIAVSDKIFNAALYTLIVGDENMIYFTVGNEVWSRNLTNGFEQKQYTVPAGETIAYIRHKKYTSEAAYAHNYIAIGTNAGGNYKIRMFEKSAGNLNANPVFILEGNGSVGDVIYISPSVSTSTYLNTY